MKSIFTLLTLTTASLLVADPYGYSQGRDSGNYYYENSEYPSESYGYDDYNSRGQNRRNGQSYYQEDQYYYQNNQPEMQGQWRQEGNNYQNDSRTNGQNEVHVYKNDSQYQNKNDNSNGRNDYNNNTNGYNDNKKMVSDQELIKNVHDALSSGWFTKGYENVSYTVNNGVVTLRGSVETEENKAKAEDNVKKIDGVKQVINQISVVKLDQKNSYDKSTSPDKYYRQDYAETEQDRMINKKIRDKLSSGWFMKGNDNVAVKTVNGAVTISGVVDSYDEIKKVNEKLKDIDGIKTLNNQLSVRKQ